MRVTRLARSILVAALVSGGLCHAQEAAAKRQIGQFVLEGIPNWDESVKDRLQQYLEVRRAGLNSIRDDGGAIIVSTRFGDTNQLHLVSTPMGARKQLTFFSEPINGGGFIPGTGGKALLFSRDVGGNENFQFYRMNLETGQSALLTDGKSRNQSVSVAKSGKRMAFSSNARNGRDMDVYVRELAGDAPPRIAWEVKGSFSPTSFSPDDARVLVQEYVSERETHVHVLDLASGKHEQITPREPALYYSGADWSHDGKAIYLTSDREGEFRKLYRVVPGGEWTCLTKDIEWDIEDVAIEPTTGNLAFVANEDGVSRLYFSDATGGNRKAVSGLPTGVIGGLRFNLKGGTIGCTVDSARAPADAYTLTYPAGVITRWTESEAGGLNTASFVEPTFIRYPTFDQDGGKPRMISALYYKSPKAGPRPVVIQVHGGPEGQTLPTFSSLNQYLAVEMGISVIAPNVRGSTGYGRSFHQLDNGVKREDSVKDVGSLLDWIAKQPELDASRIGIYGGSYGGYMVLASLTHYSDRIKAGIDVVGIADFISFLERTSEYRRDLRRAEYGDERVPEVRKVLQEIAPLRNADKIKSALFVLHGQNDPRVPVNEAQQIVTKMRDLGRPVWFANALDEGHGFQKKPNRDLATLLYAVFWNEHLLK